MRASFPPVIAQEIFQKVEEKRRKGENIQSVDCEIDDSMGKIVDAPTGMLRPHRKTLSCTQLSNSKEEPMKAYNIGTNR